VTNVTRVYWELQRPLSSFFTEFELEQNRYWKPKKAHSGVWMASRRQLLHWKEKCNFHEAPKRPGNKGQPLRGTQRVWMAGLMLFDAKFGEWKTEDRLIVYVEERTESK